MAGCGCRCPGFWGHGARGSIREHADDVRAQRGEHHAGDAAWPVSRYFKYPDIGQRALQVLIAWHLTACLR
jgi:hypothetical protein